MILRTPLDVWLRSRKRAHWLSQHAPRSAQESPESVVRGMLPDYSLDLFYLSLATTLPAMVGFSAFVWKLLGLLLP